MTAPPAADTGRVTLPAGLLIATGVCWVIFGVLATLVWVMQPKQQLPPRAQNDPAFGAGYEFGQTAAYLGMGPLSILLGSLVTLGAVQMLRLRSRGLALTASVAAMIPCLPCCLAGFPLGIWCLIVLNKPEVRSMFS